MTDTSVADAGQVDNAAPADQGTLTTPQDAQQTPSPREGFISSLPEQFRQDPAFGNFNSIEDLAKSYSHAARLTGMDKNSIVAVPKDDNQEAWGKVWDKMGRPSEVKGYEVEQYKDSIPPEVLGVYAEIAHQNGVSKKAFGAMIGHLVEESKKGEEVLRQQQEQQVSAWQNEVKQEFGAAYDQKIGFAQKAVENFGLTDIVKENVQFFEHPSIIKALAAIGEKTSEGLVLGNGDVSHGKLGPNEAMMEIARFQADKDISKALMDRNHPQHEFYMKKRSELFKAAYPQK